MLDLTGRVTLACRMATPNNPDEPPPGSFIARNLLSGGRLEGKVF
jgi:hypothetical protein